jgi:hypothetical protein
MTASVHLQILSGPVPTFPDGRLIGRDAEVRALVHALEDSVRAGGPTVIRVTGEPGSGRDAVLDRAVRNVGSTARSHIVVCPSEASSRDAALNVQAALLGQPRRSTDPTIPTVVMVHSAELPDRTVAALASTGVQEREVPVGPLDFAPLAELAQTVLAGPVSRTLVQHLEHETDGRAGDAVKLLRRWSADGSVVWTSDGLEIVPTDAGWEDDHSFGRVLQEIQRQMPYVQVELLQVLALLNRPVNADDLAPLFTGDDDAVHETAGGLSAPDVERLLDQLTDLGALRVHPRGYEFRHPRFRDATTAWTRPSARRRLRERLVEAGLLPAAASA